MSDNLGFHRFANLFPLLEGVQFRELVEDVRAHGLREPIVLHEGQILDGRNRYRACHAAQVGARFVVHDGKDPLAFVVSTNLHRRHLDTSQRAMIAAEIATIIEGRSAGARKKAGRRDKSGRLLPPLKCPDRPHRARDHIMATEGEGTSPEKAAELMNVSRATVMHAHRVIKDGVPELAAAVTAGNLSVSAAIEIALLPKQQQQKIMKSGSSVRVVSRKTRAERLEARRVARAQTGVSDVAVYDHLKIGDGRSIGNVRIGEARRVAESLQLVAGILLAVLDHAPTANHGDRVRDVINQKKLAALILDARHDEAARA